MHYDLVGIGNALVDIEVQVEDKFIEELSLLKGGMSLFTLEQQQRVLDSLSGRTTKICSGGSAANTVHGLSVLGGKGYYLGRVANDAYGRHYTRDMNRCGVGFPGPGAEAGATGTCVVLVTPDTERTMLTYLGVSGALHPGNVDETIVRNSRAAYIEGYLWCGDETRAAAQGMADFAKRAGIPVALSLSDAFVVNGFKESLVDFIRWNVDILFCNESEARAMAGCENTDAAFDHLKGMVDTLFVTLGKNGSLAWKDGEPTVLTRPFPVTAVDTTGAGDLFAAGALYGLLHLYGLEQSAIIGSYCAAQVVSHMGARLPINSHTDVKKILREYEKLETSI